jgi:acetyl-CoA/propionyl-CoA carboxylase biotin carboxyl carrier protein
MLGWRSGGRHRPLTLRVVVDGGAVKVVNVSGTCDAARVSFHGGTEIAVALIERDGEEFITLKGESHRARYLIEGSSTWVSVGGETWSLAEEDLAIRPRSVAAASNDVRSPMPGTVVQVRSTSGADVRAGEALVVVSAMKMEHVLVAPRDGTVDILVREGDSVVVDEVVARLAPLTLSTEIGS